MTAPDSLRSQSPTHRVGRAPGERRGPLPGIKLLGASQILLFSFIGCGEPSLQPTPPERITVIPGMPEARSQPGSVDEREGPSEDPLRMSRPRICESFSLQRSFRPLDVVIVMDAGRTMRQRREEMTQAVFPFLETLVKDGPTSLRVGILGATERLGNHNRGLGRLVRLIGASEPYLACSFSGEISHCNVGGGSWEEARVAFLEAVRGVESGTSSLGLLSVAELLRGAHQQNAGFLRDDAALHVVVVADADDVSCSSFKDEGSGPCHSLEGCRCEDEPSFGGVDWFVRLLEGAKGYGHGEKVSFSAWVATGERPLHLGELPAFFEGCTMGSELGETCATPWSDGVPCALGAPRYREVVAALGGSLADICADEGGLEEIGAKISGATPEFPLARKPLPSTIETVLLSIPEKSCNHLAPCSNEGLDCIRGRCGRMVPEGGTNGWRYESCSNGISKNLVRLEGDENRSQESKIEICYDVDVGADPSPCP